MKDKSPMDADEKRDGKIQAGVSLILDGVAKGDWKATDMRDTPRRVAAFYSEWISGDTPAPRLKVFETPDLGVGVSDPSPILMECPFYSLCEHHLLPFFGQVKVVYLPLIAEQDGGDRISYVIGLSKIPRVVEHYAHRLNIQEALTANIAQHMMVELYEVLANRKIRGFPSVAVQVRARHLCVEMRGVESPSLTTTHAFTGLFSRPSHPLYAEIRSTFNQREKA